MFSCGVIPVSLARTRRRLVTVGAWARLSHTQCPDTVLYTEKGTLVRISFSLRGKNEIFY